MLRRNRTLSGFLALALIASLGGCAAMFDEETNRQDFKSEPEDYSYNAKQYYHDGQYARAKDQWKKQLEEDSGDWFATLGVAYCDLWIGVIRARSGDFERARKQVTAAETSFQELWGGNQLERSTVGPDAKPKANWKPALGKALAIRGKGWIDEIQSRALSRRLDSLPTDDEDRAEIQPRIAKLVVQRDESYAAARALLQRLNEMKGRSPEVVRNLGELELILGNDARAEALLGEYLSMAKSTYEEHAKRKEEQFSEEFPTLEQFEVATTFMNEKLDGNARKRFTVLETLAALSWDRGAYRKALGYLDEASQIQPERLDLLVKKAQCHGELRNWGDGIDLLDDFIRASARTRLKWNDDVARAMRLKQEFEERLEAAARLVTDASPPPRRFRFPKSHRLVRSNEFVLVRREGRTLKDGVLRLGYLVREDDGPARLGLAVSRRAGNAVRRNRIKRVIREAFRLAPGRFPDGVDLVVVPVSKRAVDFHEVDASLERLARRLRKRLAEPRS